MILCNKVHRVAALTSLFVACIFFRSPIPLLHPRFFAEEGSINFEKCSHSTWMACLSFAYISGLQLPLNISTYLASRLAPLIYAPAVTTAMGTAVLMIVIAQLVLFLKDLQVGWVSSALAVAAVCFLPAGYETYLSATNVQWIFGISIFLVLLTPLAKLHRNKLLAACWIALCCLSGIPSVLTAPLWWLRYILERSRTLAVLATIATAGAICQFLLLRYVSGTARPPASIELGTFALGAALQTLIDPVFSADFARGIASVIRGGSSEPVAVFGCILLACGVAVPLTWAALSGPKRQVAMLIIVAWAYVTLVQEFGALQPHDFASPGSGSRYFLFGSVCLVLVSALGTLSYQRGLAIVSFSTISAIVAAGILTAAFSSWTTGLTDGPSWQFELDACPAGVVCRVMTWPGRPWMLDVVRRDAVQVDRWADRLGKPLHDWKVESRQGCRGNVDQRAIVSDQEHSISELAGWAWDDQLKRVPDLIVFTNAPDIIVGFGRLGYLREDVSRGQPGITSESTGWVAFVRPGETAELRGFGTFVDPLNRACEFAISEKPS